MTYRKNEMSDQFPLIAQDWDTNQKNARVVCSQLGFGGLYTQLKTSNFTKNVHDKFVLVITPSQHFVF